ncbi:MAG: Cytochrome c oxidase caa3-type, assembly factor CtaG-related protein [Mycobacterium sp.]|nr:Cytochrome c oxidase caa3-type, assembly factor CtaG-related protein [Mycobacterium sp.]
MAFGIDVGPLVAAALTVAGTAAGMARLRRSGGFWRATRWGWTAAGVVGLLVCAVGPVPAAEQRLAWVRVSVLCALLLGVPPLLAAGRPVSLYAASGARGGVALRRWLSDGVGAFLVGPLTGPLLVPLGFSVVLFTGVWHVSVTSALAQALLGFLLVPIGLLVALPLVGESGEDASGGMLAAGLLIGFIELLADAIPGIALRLRTHLLDPGWALAAHGGNAHAALADQRLAGAILWAVAELIDLPFLVLVFRRWVTNDVREQARVDREIEATPLVAPQPRPDRPAEPGLEAPWWETDPTRLGEERSAKYRR